MSEHEQTQLAGSNDQDSSARMIDKESKVEMFEHEGF